MRRALERRLDEDRADARRIERGRDDVRREPVVEVAAVAQLDLLDRRVADRLERAALHLALGEDAVDDPADVVGGDDVADVHLAGVQVDVDLGDAGGPAERRVGIARIGRVVERRAARIRLEPLVDPHRAVLPGVGRGTESANGAPVVHSTLSRSRWAALMTQATHDHRGPRRDGRAANRGRTPCPTGAISTSSAGIPSASRDELREDRLGPLPHLGGGDQDDDAAVGRSARPRRRSRA